MKKAADDQPQTIHLGFEIGSGAEVEIPLKHTAVTGVTQEAGKTTTLEAMIARSGLRAVTFITKRGEGSFTSARRIDPYFREQADWQFVASILEASRGEKMRFERAWIIRASKGARTLADVQRNVRKAMAAAKGMSADVYLTLDAYLDAVVPQIAAVRWAPMLTLSPGVNAMDLTGLNVEMQHLVIKSSLDWVLAKEDHTVVVIPEAWKFIPQGRGTPVKLAAEAFIRQGAGLKNFVWLDSQDIAGIEKIILKSVPLWILGVQREANEIKRTLDNIPAGIAKPSKADIATLGLGQFYACWGRHAVKTFVQPAWMNAAQAQQVATGALAVDAATRLSPGRVTVRIPKEDQVTKDEAAQLMRENETLKADNADLRRRLEAVEKGQQHEHADPPGRDDRPAIRATAPAGAAAGLHVGRGAGREREPSDTPGRRTFTADESLDQEQIYQATKARLIEEAASHPALLRILVSRPELLVDVERQEIRADGSSLRGRIGRLIAEGFFDKGDTGAATQKELGRRGKDDGPGNTYKELDNLATLGFLTIEQGRDERSRPRKEYRAVPGMKVNIVERDDTGGR